MCMSRALSIIIEYLIVFIILFLLMYFVFTTSGMKNKKVKKNNTKNGKEKNKNSEDDVPLELVYLTGIYGIDPKNVNKRGFRFAYSIINSFVISTTYIISVYLVKNVILKVCIAVVVLILLIIACYGLLGRYYIYKEDNLKEDNLMNQEDGKDV